MLLVLCKSSITFAIICGTNTLQIILLVIKYVLKKIKVYKYFLLIWISNHLHESYDHDAQYDRP